MIRRYRGEQGTALTEAQARSIRALFAEKGIHAIKDVHVAICAGKTRPDGLPFISQSHLYKVLNSRGKTCFTTALMHRIAEVLTIEVAVLQRKLELADLTIGELDFYKHNSHVESDAGDHAKAAHWAEKVLALMDRGADSAAERAQYSLMIAKHNALAEQPTAAVSILIDTLKELRSHGRNSPEIFCLTSRIKGRTYKYLRLHDQSFDFVDYRRHLDGALQQTRDYLQANGARRDLDPDDGMNEIKIHLAHGVRELASICYLQGDYQRASTLYCKARTGYAGIYPEPICDSELGSLQSDMMLRPTGASPRAALRTLLAKARLRRWRILEFWVQRRLVLLGGLGLVTLDGFERSVTQEFGAGYRSDECLVAKAIHFVRKGKLAPCRALESTLFEIRDSRDILNLNRFGLLKGFAALCLAELSRLEQPLSRDGRSSDEATQRYYRALHIFSSFSCNWGVVRCFCGLRILGVAAKTIRLPENLQGADATLARRVDRNPSAYQSKTVLDVIL